MSTIDDKIRQALSDEDEAAIAKLNEQAGLFEMIGMSLHGKQAWMTYYMWTLGFAAFAFSVYAFLQFLAAEETANQLLWVLAIQVCLTITIIVKVVGFIQMGKLETLRAIKRLEIRLLSQD